MPSVSKILSAVEVVPKSSNQHELNGVAQFKGALGLDRFKADAFFEHSSGVTAIARVTWYDSREANPDRTEHRLYFQTNPVMNLAKPGDTLTVIVDPDPTVQLRITVSP